MVLEIVGLEEYWVVIDVDGGIVGSYYDEQDAINFVNEVNAGRVSLS